MKISIEQINKDITRLENDFIKYSGAWENNDGDYGCISIAENELKLCKGIAKRYPFKYEYQPSRFDKSPNDDDWTDIEFSIDDFDNNNVNQHNYEKVDAVAFDFKEELVGMLDMMKEELEWLPPRFREEFIEILCCCEQDRHSIRKNCEFFSDTIYNELTEEEKEKMFISL